MKDAENTAFLQWALPRLGRRWAGYRKVRRLVGKRLDRRLRLLALPDLAAYRTWLEAHPQEWPELDALLGIPISRFWRDREVFESIERDVLPALAASTCAAGRTTLAAWSAGCASGEEPYTLAILWRGRLQRAWRPLGPRIVATDSDAQLIERARDGCYLASSVRELPADLRAASFDEREGRFCVRVELRTVEFLCQDLREQMPDGPFDLVCLRNVIATYYELPIQREIIDRIAARMRPGSALVLGVHEALPQGVVGLEAWPGARAVYRRTAI